MEFVRCSLLLPTGETLLTDIDKEFYILPNFRLWELANMQATDAQTVDGVRFAIDSRWGWMMLDMLQCTRYHFDSRFDINSFYRTQAFNNSLPDATPDSQHCHSQAADVVDYYNVGTDDDWVHWWERLCKINKQIGAIGLYPKFRHIEIGSDRRYGAKKFEVRDHR